MVRYIFQWLYSITGWSVSIPVYNIFDFIAFFDVLDNADDSIFCVGSGWFVVRIIFWRL